MRYLFILLCLLSFAFSKSEVFVLPKEAKEAKETIVSLINDSQKNITIAMYNFSYKKFAKALKEAKKRGVEVTIIFDKKKIEEKESLYSYFKKHKINCVIVDEKMHLKVALFDNKTMLLGSTNFTKKSFSDNYEILYSTQNKKHLKKVENFLKELM